MNNYSQYFAIEKKIKERGFKMVSRDFLILGFTDGKKSSLRDLTPSEYKEFIKYLNLKLNENEPSTWMQTPANKMRRKIIGLFVHQMGYTMEELDQWCLKYGSFKKILMGHNTIELTTLVTQAENTYASFIKGMKKRL